MPASISDKITKTFNSVNPNVARVTASRAAGVTTLACDNLAGWPTDTAVHFSTYRTGTDGTVTSGTQIDWKGIVSANNITNLTRLAGATDAGSSINDVVEMNPTASWANDLAGHILTQHNQDGTHSAITATSASISGNLTVGGTVTIAGTTNEGGWSAGSGLITAVTNNGNRSYTLTTSADLSGTISNGMRLRTTNTVAGPTQCTSLNGTNQYWNDTTVSGMTFTDDFVVGAWVKLSSYQLGTIISRSTTSGWSFQVTASGQVDLIAFNGGFGNNSRITSYQSLPLNKWVHITAQLDMSAFTATSTTSYIMIDGVDVPSSVSRAGTNPTALVQAGNIEVGSSNGGTNLFPGKIASAFVSSAKITQANVRTLMSQGLTASLISTHSIISAYSFNGNGNDLNTTNANNLTAQNSATATNADSYTGVQAGGSVSSTLNYAIVTGVTSSTLTVQVPEGCTIPTSGGISAFSYSTYKAPYGMPAQRGKWSVLCLINSRVTGASGVAALAVTNPGGICITAPVGEWVTYTGMGGIDVSSVSVVNLSFAAGLSSSASAISDLSLVSQSPYTATSLSQNNAYLTKTGDISASTATPYYYVFKPLSAGATHTLFTGLDSGGGNDIGVIKLENAYL